MGRLFETAVSTQSMSGSANHFVLLWHLQIGIIYEALLADTPGCANAADLHELFDILDPYLAGL